MKTLVIRPLTSELNADYLDFFDHRAFTDDNPNGPCYCTSPNQEKEQIEKMVSEFKTYGVKETLRKYAIKMLDKNQIHGYLAYDGDLPVGWCNAADMESYAGFVPAFARDIISGKTISIVCFEIAPEYRGMGIASALIDRVCADAKSRGGADRILDQAEQEDVHVFSRRTSFSRQNLLRNGKKCKSNSSSTGLSR